MAATISSVTIRTYIKSKRRQAFLVGIVGFALLVTASVIGQGFPALVFLGFVMFAGAILYQLFAIRCPRCRGNLGGPLAYASGPIGVSRRVRFCLYCGVELDTAIPPN